ncbi:MAG: hypothetical protein FWF94_04610 [Oscillospiraceae bacterium]|nr:hypothetical protein [Oscillospiraceae bacterium]
MKNNKLFGYLEGVTLTDDMKERLIAQVKEAEQNNPAITIKDKNGRFIRSGVMAAAMFLLFLGAVFLINPNRNNINIDNMPKEYSASEQIINSTGDKMSADAHFAADDFSRDTFSVTSGKAEGQPANPDVIVGGSVNTETTPAINGIPSVPVAAFSPAYDGTVAEKYTIPAVLPPVDVTQPPKITDPPQPALPFEPDIIDEEPEATDEPEIIDEEPKATAEPPANPNLVNLSYMDIDDRQLSEMVESGEIPDTVEALNLQGNPISDLTPLEDLANLSVLYLPDNLTITDITPLNTLPNLATLSLGYNIVPPEQLNELRENLPDLVVLDYYQGLYD